MVAIKSKDHVKRSDSLDCYTECSEILKYEMGTLEVGPLVETEMLRIEDENVKNDWLRAVKHTKFQETKLKKVVQSPLRNKPITKASLVHLYEALKHIDHDQGLDSNKCFHSILNFGFMSGVSNYFQKISLFSLTIYDVSNKRCLKLLCKPAVLAPTVFIDDVCCSSPGLGSAFTLRDFEFLH
jgi:hypothetical protein